MKSRAAAIFAAIIAVLLLTSFYLFNRNRGLEREIAADLADCERRIAHLQDDYRAEIDDLRHYVREQYDQSAGGVADAGSPGVRASRGDRRLVRATERKYKYLLDELGLNDADRERLMQLLLERERTTRLIGAARESDDPAAGESIPRYEARLAEIDEEINALLGAAEVQTYEMLKESDIEQHHLGEYTGGITHVAPVSPEQDRAILFAKLRHKQIFETVLRDAGFYRDRLSQAEREHASAVVSQALDDYKNNFLQDVQGLLEEEQFILLSNYENTEFNWEKERLLQQIDSKR